MKRRTVAAAAAACALAASAAGRASAAPGVPSAPGVPPEKQQPPPPPASPMPAPAQRTLRVSGEGRASAAPDVAIATVGVVALDPSLAAATREANERARRVHDVVQKAGIAPRDVQTSRYEVELERRADKPDEAPRVVGYRVVNELRVKVRDLAALGPLLDRLVAAGANAVQGLAFARDDVAPEQARALADAVRSARAKAEEMARAAGVRLGDLLELSEGGRVAPGPIPLRRMAAAEASGPAIESGQIEVTAEVDAVYAIH
jgi:uncharacterized protein